MRAKRVQALRKATYCVVHDNKVKFRLVKRLYGRLRGLGVTSANAMQVIGGMR